MSLKKGLSHPMLCRHHFTLNSLIKMFTLGYSTWNSILCHFARFWPTSSSQEQIVTDGNLPLNRERERLDFYHRAHCHENHLGLNYWPICRAVGRSLCIICRGYFLLVAIRPSDHLGTPCFQCVHLNETKLGTALGGDYNLHLFRFRISKNPSTEAGYFLLSVQWFALICPYYLCWVEEKTQPNQQTCAWKSPV